MSRFGYACINMQLQKEQKVQCNRKMIKRTFLSKGIPYASELSLSNVTNLEKVVEWNNENGVGVFRITSCLFPWKSEYSYSDLPDMPEIEKTLARIGKKARDGGQRLSFHPGPFNVLASKGEDTVMKTIKELDDHSDIFDMMGYEATHNTKINIHVGGAYGDHKSALERFCTNFDKLKASTKKRLTVENDDRASLYSVKMLYEGVYSNVGVPIVFDSHHFQLGPQDQTYEEAFEMATSTWGDVVPTCHHSNSKRLYENPKVVPSAHSDYYYEPFNDMGKNVDVVLECKAKELALEKYKNDFL